MGGGWMANDVIAETTSGKNRGLRTGSAHALKGDPYDASTGGARRFRPPEAAAPWPGVRDAVAYGPRAPQCESSFSVAPEIRDLVTPTPTQSLGEDCLVLNL